jgi:hypothetical protein
MRLMYDSPYRPTASRRPDSKNHLESEQAFLKLADELDTETLFLNRCNYNYLAPALAWTCVTNRGSEVSLRKFGT